MSGILDFILCHVLWPVLNHMSAHRGQHSPSNVPHREVCVKVAFISIYAMKIQQNWFASVSFHGWNAIRLHCTSSWCQIACYFAHLLVLCKNMQARLWCVEHKLALINRALWVYGSGCGRYARFHRWAFACTCNLPPTKMAELLQETWS